jgi:hypothetical protein
MGRYKDSNVKGEEGELSSKTAKLSWLKGHFYIRLRGFSCAENKVAFSSAPCTSDPAEGRLRRSSKSCSASSRRRRAGCSL